MGMVIVALVVFVLSYIFLEKWRQRKERKSGVPGPWPWPFVGNLPHIANALRTSRHPLASIAKHYGDLTQLQVGPKKIVVVSSIDTLYDIYTKEETFGRDPMGLLADRVEGQNLGMALSEKEVWEQTRRWSVRNLRDFGFGKTSSTEASVKEEIKILLSLLEQSKTRLDDGREVGYMDVNHIFLVPVTKLMWKMTVARCTPKDEEIIRTLVKKTEGLAAASGFIAVGIFFPWLSKIAPQMTGSNAQKACDTEFHKAALEMLEVAREKLKSDPEPNSLTEKYVMKMEKELARNSPEAKIFTETHFGVLFRDLFQAFETSCAFLESMMLYMILYPDVQEKIYQEIKRAIPDDEEVTYEHRKEMLYTQAAMQEVHRIAKVTQNLIPRKALTDIEYGKYFFKKGTIFIADLESCFMDPRLWKDPEDFNPMRFISKDGKELVNMRNVVPFGVGKRNCPGDTMGMTVSFMIVVSLFRQYKISVMPGKPMPTTELKVGFTSRPYPIRAMITKRN